jgi:rfaE bifunctional protein kinase chain/domain
MDSARFQEIAARFAGTRVLVVGDLMLDEFVWGKVSRISPEAPVPVVNVTAETYYAGGAANVARNVREFGAATSVMGLAGMDPQGCQLVELLASAGIETGGIERDPAFPTIVKTRIFARNQQVVRVDRESKPRRTAEQHAVAASRLGAAMGAADAVIVADYGKGFLTQPLADHLCQTARDQRKILTVDPHPHTSLCWRNATAIKPNRTEAFSAAGVAPSDALETPAVDSALLDAAHRLQTMWNPQILLITLGEQGMLLFDGAAAPHHLPTRAHDVFDVSGAGDTALAVFTLGLAAGASALEAAELANRASGIAVGKLGTATVSLGELAAEFPA